MLRALVLLAVALLAGCATPSAQGAAAYRQGRYDEAASRFEAVLAEDPERIDALVGLGLSRYMLRDDDAAIQALARAVARAPQHATAQLFLGLAYLRRAQDRQAVEHLTAFRDLVPAMRTATLVEGALKLLREGQPTRELREFMAASLESAVEWQREVGEAYQALQDEELRRLSRERTILVVPRGCRC